MSFDHPECKAFSKTSHWIFWSAMLAGSMFFLGFSVWQMGRHETRSSRSTISRASDQARRAPSGRDDRKAFRTLRMGQAHRETPEREGLMSKFNHIAFGIAASRLKADADKLSRDAHLALVYANDTANSAGQADFDLLQAAHCLELAARDARLLHAKVQQLRADQSNPVLIAAE